LCGWRADLSWWGRSGQAIINGVQAEDLGSEAVQGLAAWKEPRCNQRPTYIRTLQLKCDFLSCIMMLSLLTTFLNLAICFSGFRYSSSSFSCNDLCAFWCLWMKVALSITGRLTGIGIEELRVKSGLWHMELLCFSLTLSLGCVVFGRGPNMRQNLRAICNNIWQSVKPCFKVVRHFTNLFLDGQHCIFSTV
jgi:hypothetical protein